MVKVQKNSMVLAAVVCLVGQAQAMDLTTARNLVGTSLAICTVDSVAKMVEARDLNAGYLPVGIQNKVRPTAVETTTKKVDVSVRNASTNANEIQQQDVPTMTVTAAERLVGLRVGHVTAGVRFPAEGSPATKILNTQVNVEGADLRTVAIVGGTYLVAAQLPNVIAKVAALLGKK